MLVSGRLSRRILTLAGFVMFTASAFSHAFLTSNSPSLIFSKTKIYGSNRRFFVFLFYFFCFFVFCLFLFLFLFINEKFAPRRFIFQKKRRTCVRMFSFLFLTKILRVRAAIFVKLFRPFGASRLATSGAVARVTRDALSLRF